MKLIRKNFWLVAILMALVLVGCKGKEDPKNVFEQTYDNMSQKTNFKVEMNINKGLGEDIDTTSMVFGFDLDENMLGAVKVDTTLFGIEHQGYRELTENEVLSYTSVANTGSWIKKTMTMDDFKQSDVDHENYFTILTSLTDENFVNEMTIDDTKYNVYTIKLNDPKVLDDVFNENQQSALATIYGLTDDELDAYFTEVTYEVTLDPQANLLRSVKSDLSEVFVKLATDFQEKNSTAPTISFDQVNLDITFSDFDAVEVEIPAEVKETAIAK